MFPELVTRRDLHVFLPPIGGMTVYIFGDVAKLADPNAAAHLPRPRRVQRLRRVRLRHLHLPPLPHPRHRGMRPRRRKSGGSGVIVYNRKEGRALGEVTKFLVYNARKRQEGGDRAATYFERTECVAGVQDVRFQQLMPDVLHWLGIGRIDRFVSMSDMKYDARRAAGIEIVERVPIPDDLIPPDAHVEIDAKKAAGYFTEGAVPRRERAREGQGPGPRGMSGSRDRGDDAQVRYLRSAGAIRERCEAIHALALKGDLEHWSIDAGRLDAVAERVVKTTRAAYPDLRAIPKHSRWRHFAAGGVDRAGDLDARLAASGDEERLAARFELAITSVLLDAGAGDRWRYRDANGREFARSEGIAVASYDLFVAGAFSGDPGGSPLRADAQGLAATSTESLARGFQVGEGNPMVGVEGRATLMRKLGQAVGNAPAWQGRLGGFGVRLARSAAHGVIAAEDVLSAVLSDLGTIWPGREVVAGQNLGDVWWHPTVGRVPFHKLSQWLTYSLLEPLEWAGLSIVGLGELTGLAEYRNGGLFVDGGVLVPKHDDVLRSEHDVSSPVVVEWRALTVALLDRVADRVRALLGLSADELPLANVLEGGTWRAGRELAAELRPGGGPPLRVRSDGTVF